MVETVARRFSELRAKAESETEPNFDVDAYIQELNGSSNIFDKGTEQENIGLFFESRSNLVAEQVALIAVKP